MRTEEAWQAVTKQQPEANVNPNPNTNTKKKKQFAYYGLPIFFNSHFLFFAQTLE